MMSTISGKYVTKHSSTRREMRTDMYGWSHKTKGGGWRVNLLFVLCTCAIMSKGEALSVIVQNGTFELGSIDAQMEVKITPRPKTVEWVNWYHCSSSNACSAFYSVDNIKAMRHGDLGERTSHIIMKNDQEYIIFLVITKPKDNDQGEYRCQIQVAHENKPLQGNLRLTKLEALRDASAENITVEVGASVMSLAIRIFPANTTLYWLKCFHSTTPEPSALFYTYNKNLNTVLATGDLGSRTSHKAEIRKQKMWFSLIIQNPNTDDAGPYCCQVDAVGLMKPRLVVMWIEIIATNLPPFKENPPGINTTTALKQGEGPSESSEITIILLYLFAVSIIIVIGVYYIYGRMTARRVNRDTLLLTI